jgi:hypothetical protein
MSLTSSQTRKWLPILKQGKRKADNNKVKDNQNLETKQKALKVIHCLKCESNTHDEKDCKLNLECDWCGQNGHLNEHCFLSSGEWIVNPNYDYTNMSNN